MVDTDSGQGCVEEFTTLSSSCVISACRIAPKWWLEKDPGVGDLLGVAGIL